MSNAKSEANRVTFPMKNAIYDEHYIALVGRLKSRRRALGLDQAAVAAKLGYTNRWLSKVEKPDIRLDVMTFIRLCRALGLRAHGLIKDVEESLEEDSPPLSCQRLMNGWNLCFRESCGVPVGF